VHALTGAEKVKEVETNAHKIEQRQKQVDFGKNTLGYESYRTQVPKYVPLTTPNTPPVPRRLPDSKRRAAAE
jgi:histone RNA hairpin-binding protein